MTEFFRTLERILTSRSYRLEILAEIAGLSAEELFLDESFDGIDLRNEPIEVLKRIDADFSRAILTVEQKRRLGRNQTSRDARSQIQRAKTVIALRQHRMEAYLTKHFPEHRQDAARDVLVSPLVGTRSVTDGWTDAERAYAAEALRFLVREREQLTSPIEVALLDLLLQIRAIRVPVGSKVVDLLLSEPIVKLNESTMRMAFDFDFCTDEFVYRWLDEYGATESTEDAYQAALKLAIVERSHASREYLSSVTERARSYSNCVDLLRQIKPRLIDREGATQLARILSGKTLTLQEIEAAVLESVVDQRIIAAFRRLVAASGDKAGREALLRVISRVTDKASGIELDTLLSDIGFDAGVQLMKPFWSKLPLHYRRIALDCLAGQAGEFRQSKKVAELRSEYLSDIT